MDITITDIKDFPSEQAEEIQKYLKELDTQGKLLDYFREQYPNLGKYNSLANYILKNWEKDGKKLFIEYTGIEVCDDKCTIKRTGVKLNGVAYGSGRYFLWKCSTCRNEWVAQPAKLTSENFKRGCTECAKKRTAEASHLKGESLANWCNTNEKYGEQLKEEFVGLDENNKPIVLGDISRGSKQRVWWRCSKCHKIWLAVPINRTSSNRTGCPHCLASINTSFPEQFIFNSLLQLFPNTKNRQKDIINHYEYDIVIPELNLCIEYSGYSWHKAKLERDQAKANHCKKNGVQFLQIYAHQGEITDEQGLEINDIYTKEQIIYKVNNDKTLHIIQLQQIIKFILEQYAPNHSIAEIDFELAEQKANEIMGKA